MKKMELKRKELLEHEVLEGSNLDLALWHPVAVPWIFLSFQLLSQEFARACVEAHRNCE